MHIEHINLTHILIGVITRVESSAEIVKFCIPFCLPTVASFCEQNDKRLQRR